MDWYEGAYEIRVKHGRRTVQRTMTGYVSRDGVWGIRNEGQTAPMWAITHVPTGYRISPNSGYHKLAHAQSVVERIAPLAEWAAVRVRAGERTGLPEAVADAVRHELYRPIPHWPHIGDQGTVPERPAAQPRRVPADVGQE